jgi:hypothetical protein
MSTVKVSGDGKEFFEIPDSDVAEAMDKGYQPYFDVSGDGKEFHTIPGDDLQEASSKGYKLKSVWDSQAETMHPVAKGAVDAGMTGIQKVGKVADYLTGAPTRAGLYELVKPREEMAPVGRWTDAAKAFAGQYLKDPSTAPTEKDIGTSIGLSDKESIKIPMPFYTTKGGFQVDDMAVSPAGIAGGIMGGIADPTNYLGIGGATSMGVKGTRQAVGGAVKGVAKVAKAVDESAEMAKIISGPLKRTVKTVADAEDIGRAIGSSPIIKTSVAPDFPELAKIAQEFDIPVDQLPARVEFGPKSTATRLEQARMDSPLGEPLREKHNAIVTKVRDATEGLNERIGGGAAFNSREAGDVIREGYRKNVATEMADQENSYAKVTERMGETPVAEGGMTDVAKKWRKKVYEENLENVRDPDTGLVIQKPSAKGQAILDNIEGASQAGNLQELHQQIKIVGQQAFADPRTFGAPIDQRAMRELYADLRKSFTETVESVEPKQATKLKDHNARMTKVLEDRKIFERVVENVDKDSEAVFKFFTGNSERIKRMKEILTPGEFQAAKSGVVSSLFTSTANEPWTFAGLNRSINKNRKTLEAILDPAEMKSLENLTTLGNRLGPDTLNTSGTEVLRGFKEFATKPVRTLLEGKTMQKFGDQLAEGARLDAVNKGMAVEGSKLPAYAPQGMATQLDKTVSSGPLRNSFNSDMTMGQRALDAVGKGRLYSKHKYQDYQERENERTRDYDAAERIKGVLQTDPQRLGKYGPQLKAAIDRGGNSFAVTHFLLQQKEQDYRAAVKALDE